MAVQTPSSIRDVKGKGHGYCTANYTGSNTLNFLPQDNTSFWEEARKIKKDLTSPSAKAQALHSFGLLAYIPDPDPNPTQNPDYKPNEKTPTGWETFLLNKSSSETPFFGSLGVSNLGYVNLPEGAVDIVWSQAISPFAPVYEINLGSCEKGLRAVTLWREGGATSRENVLEVERVWKRILRRLGESGEGVILADLVKPE